VAISVGASAAATLHEVGQLRYVVRVGSKI
jgi:hypothetical protein